MRKCLIVDDSKIVRKLARRIVEPMGFEITEAEDGQKAVEACQQEMPYLILLDWYMPVMNGIEFIQHLRQMPGGEEPKVIFCTTENDFNCIMTAMECGANEYVMKPFDEDIIRGKLEQIGAL